MDDAENKDHKQLKKDYQGTFDTKEGKRVLDDLKSAYYHRGSYQKDPYETAFREGQRSVIIRIINLMKEDKNV
jgi:hypothetical protein|tara:strand:+ start:983 stop:1201 length:219 start_codon:yes stop_codon:yes gene_type:complete